MVSSRFALMLAAGLVAAPAASADIYKWVGKDGRVTYSDVRPKDPDLAVEVLLVSDPSPPSVAPAQIPDATVRQMAELRALAERLERLLEEERRLRAAPSYVPPPPPPIVENGWSDWVAPATVVIGAPVVHHDFKKFKHHHFRHGDFKHDNFKHGHFKHGHFKHGHFKHDSFKHGHRFKHGHKVHTGGVARPSGGGRFR